MNSAKARKDGEMKAWLLLTRLRTSPRFVPVIIARGLLRANLVRPWRAILLAAPVLPRPTGDSIYRTDEEES